MSRFFLFFCFCFVDLVVEAESSPTGGKLMQSIHNLKEKKKRKTDRRGKTETTFLELHVSVFILVRFSASNPVDRRF